MRFIPHPKPICHGIDELPLFKWAGSVRRVKLTTGGRYLHRRMGLPPSLANAVAEIHGLGREVTP